MLIYLADQARCQLLTATPRRLNDATIEWFTGRGMSLIRGRRCGGWRPAAHRGSSPLWSVSAHPLADGPAAPRWTWPVIVPCIWAVVPVTI